MYIKIIRWLCAIGFAAMAVHFFLLSGQEQEVAKDAANKNLVGVGMNILYSFFSAFAVLILLIPELKFLLGEPIQRLISGLFLSEEKIDKSPLNYKLAKFYRENERYEEELEEFERQIPIYPDEKALYLGAAEACWDAYFDKAESLKYLEKGLKQFPEDEEILTLQEDIKNREEPEIIEEEELEVADNLENAAENDLTDAEMKNVDDKEASS